MVSHVERMGDEKIAKQVLNGSVEGVRGRGRPKEPWLGVVDKCLNSKNIRSTVLIKCKRTCKKKYNECEGSKCVRIELNGGQFVGGRIKGGDMILCCWLTP
jgi:hypothetical protein